MADLPRQLQDVTAQYQEIQKGTFEVEVGTLFLTGMGR